MHRLDPSYMRKPDYLRLLALSLLPLLTIFGLIAFNHARGPFYFQYNQDPDYCYLLNGLGILNGFEPAHTDHPGTTLQYFIAGVLYASEPGLSTAQRTNAILANPEHYLSLCSFALEFMVVISLLLLGYVALRCSDRLDIALLAQSGPLLFAEIPLSGSRVYPEALSISICNLLICGFLAIYFAARQPSRRFTGLIVFLGFLSALLVDTKMLAAPFVITFFLVAVRLRAALAFTASFAITLLALLILIRSRLLAIWEWIVANATHSERYGHGSPGFISRMDFLHNAIGVFSAQINLTILLILSAAVAIIGYFLRRSARACNIWHLSALLIAYPIALIFVFKSPAQHYLIVPFCFGPLLLILIHHSTGELLRDYRVARTIITAGLPLAVLIVGTASLRTSHRQMLAARSAATGAIASMQKEPQAAAIYTYRASTQEYALAFGNIYAGYRFTHPLQQLYPKAIDYNPWGMTLSRFDYSTQLGSFPKADKYYLLGTMATDATARAVGQLLFARFSVHAIENIGGERMVLLESEPATK